MKNVIAVASILLGLCLGGCVSVPGKVYSGTYFYNFESSSFTPDGTDEYWCLSGNMERAELPGKGPSGPWGTANVVVRGQLSPPGHYCNLGASKYMLKVYKILKVTDKHAEDK